MNLLALPVKSKQKFIHINFFVENTSSIAPSEQIFLPVNIDFYRNTSIICSLSVVGERLLTKLFLKHLYFQLNQWTTVWSIRFPQVYRSITESENRPQNTLIKIQPSTVRSRNNIKINQQQPIAPNKK